MERPTRNTENLAIIIAIAVTFYLLLAFINKDNSLHKDLLRPSGIFAAIFLLVILWGWAIYAMKSYERNSFKWIEFLKTSDYISNDLKETIEKYEKTFNEGIISKDEFFNKLTPTSKLAEQQLKKVQLEKQNDEYFLIVEKIKAAHSDGVISKDEMDKKIEENKRRFNKI